MRKLLIALTLAVGLVGIGSRAGAAPLSTTSCTNPWSGPGNCVQVIGSGTWVTSIGGGAFITNASTEYHCGYWKASQDGFVIHTSVRRCYLFDGDVTWGSTWTENKVWPNGSEACYWFSYWGPTKEACAEVHS